MKVCESFSGEGLGPCIWCWNPKLEHQAGDCPTCFGYGYLYENGEPAYELSAERPVTCWRCEGVGFIDRAGRPARFVNHADYRFREGRGDAA